MIIGSRLRQKRLAAGYSLDELAAAMGGLVTKQALSKYETGKCQPTQVVLNTLASALAVKASMLSSESSTVVKFHGFRKQAKLGKRAQEEIMSRVTAQLEQRIELQSFYRTAGSVPVPYKLFPTSSLAGAETAAASLREAWGLGSAPLADVTSTLEEHMVHVLELSETDHFDGLSATVADADETIIGGAVICRHETAGERQRFSLAHELGHLVMKVKKDVDDEAAANRFAGAFLVPNDTLMRLIGAKRHHVSLDELLLLKQRFGVSMQALLYRMKDLRIVSQSYYTEWCITISALGYKKREPKPLLREEPKWFRRSILQAVTEGWITKGDGERMLQEPLDIEEPLSLDQRRAFMKLPLEERRRLMAEQAAALAAHYESDTEWKEAEGGDIIEY